MFFVIKKKTFSSPNSLSLSPNLPQSKYLPPSQFCGFFIYSGIRRWQILHKRHWSYRQRDGSLLANCNLERERERWEVACRRRRAVWDRRWGLSEGRVVKDESFRGREPPDHLTISIILQQLAHSQFQRSWFFVLIMISFFCVVCGFVFKGFVFMLRCLVWIHGFFFL